MLTQAPVLAFPLFDRGFTLDTDASGVGLGAVLSQRQDDGIVCPIAFASRSLQPHEKNYGVTELEALGVVWAVKYFCHYLYGHQCEVYTDHEALKSLLNSPHPSGKLARWGLALQEVDLIIHYRPGRKNANADALSRNPPSNTGEDPLDESTMLVAAITPQVSTKSGDRNPSAQPVDVPKDHSTLPQRQREDNALASIITYLETGQLPQETKKARELALTSSQYLMQDNILYHVSKDKSLQIIPPTPDREALFREAHSGVFGAHLREAKIHSELARQYWWPQMRNDIRKW